MLQGVLDGYPDPPYTPVVVRVTLQVCDDAQLIYECTRLCKSRCRVNSIAVKVRDGIKLEQSRITTVTLFTHTRSPFASMNPTSTSSPVASKVASSSRKNWQCLTNRQRSSSLIISHMASLPLPSLGHHTINSVPELFKADRSDSCNSASRVVRE